MIRTRLQGDTPFFPNMLNNGMVEVCLKEDVDKVIVEKDKEITELKMKLAAAQQVLRFNQPEVLYSNLETMSRLTHEKYVVERRERHHKYKRCLAMSKLCHWKMGVFIYKKEKSDFYYRWYKRWLELAEKFRRRSDGKRM